MDVLDGTIKVKVYNEDIVLEYYEDTFWITNFALAPAETITFPSCAIPALIEAMAKIYRKRINANLKAEKELEKIG